MATHRSAEKRHRQSLKRRERNKHWLSTTRNAVRAVRAAAAGGDKDALEKFANAERLLRKGASKGVLHKRTISRTISRLHKLVH
jgi:small subunit ribosomal protein S20